MTAAVIGPAALLVATVAAACGAGGLLYLPFWIAAALPAVPLARRIAGDHVVGLVGGGAAGYTATSLAWWAVIRAGWTSPLAFALAWALVAAALLAAARAVPRAPLPLPAWERRDALALCAVLLLVPALMVVPYRHLGAIDAQGARYYRAYFTADFVWHTALTSELQRFEMPPRNPYLAREPLHYYWTYFIVPAVVTARGPRAVSDVQTALKVNAIATAFLLIGSVYALASTATRRRAAAVLAVLLVALASSAEASAALASLIVHGRPLASVRDMNIDAVTAWWYDGLRIDGIHRTMYYTPQHGLSCTLGLLGLVPLALAGARLGTGGIAISGVLLGLATTLNPFLGAAFCAVYGLAVALDVAAARPPARVLLRHAIAAAAPLLAVAWGLVNGMGEGAGSALTIGWAGNARHAPLLTLLLSLGPILIPAVFGLLPDRRLPRPPLTTALAALSVGLVLLYFVMLTDRSWVGFRAGQILIAALAVPLARVLDRLFALGSRLPLATVVAAVLVAGAPTTVIDAYNAGDIANRRMGPGFPWTIVLSPAQREGLAWLRSNTAATAIVQAEPIARGRAEWSLIPSFAGRRMAAGLPISLLPSPAYDQASRVAQRIFTAPTAAGAHAAARSLGIEYLWVDGDDARAYPAGVERLRSGVAGFTPVFTDADVAIYAVR